MYHLSEYKKISMPHLMIVFVRIVLLWCLCLSSVTDCKLYAYQNNNAQKQDVKKNGQSIIPVLADTYVLEYKFPTRVDIAVADEGIPVEPPLLYRVEWYGSELLNRKNNRNTKFQYNGNAEYFFSAAPVSVIGTDTYPQGTIDIDTNLKSFVLKRRVGDSIYSYTLDETGLTEQDPFAGQKHYELLDKYYQNYTVDALVSQSGSLRVNNGALRADPNVPPFFVALGEQWVYASLPALIPPIPAAVEIPPGRMWEAGAPILVSVKAEPVVVRFTIVFEGYDDESGLAEFTWTGKTASLPIVPAAGIHHIKKNAFADVEITGRMLLEYKTGFIQYSKVHITSNIEQPVARDPAVVFKMDFIMNRVEYDIFNTASASATALTSATAGASTAAADTTNTSKD